MPAFQPDRLAEWARGTWTSRPSGALTGFSADSRRIGAGECFVALRTDRRDGHDFLRSAMEAGAGAAIVSRADPTVSLPQLVVEDPLAALQAIARAHRLAFGGRVVGISGSCGKTSTKELLALLLGGQEGGVLSTEGNLNNHLGVPLTLTRIDPVRHRFAVVEAGISAEGDMDSLAAMIEPDVAIITLVAEAHLKDLGSLEGVAREKAKLPRAVRPAGMAVFPRQCADLPAFGELGVDRMILEPADVIRPAEPPKDVVYFTVTQREETTAIAIAYGPPPPLVFTLRRVSPGMAQNVALAICSALWLGVSPAMVQERIGGWGPAHWRGEVVRDGGRLLYVDCYNANPASMRDALANFRDLASAAGPSLYLLGCMEELGPEAPAYHRGVGRSLTLRPGDLAVLVGNEAASLRDGLLEAGAAPDQVRVISDAAQAAPLVAGWTGSVFVKGSRKYRLETALEGAAAVAAH